MHDVRRWLITADTCFMRGRYYMSRHSSFCIRISHISWCCFSRQCRASSGNPKFLVMLDKSKEKQPTLIGFEMKNQNWRCHNILGFGMKNQDWRSHKAIIIYIRFAKWNTRSWIIMHKLTNLINWKNNIKSSISKSKAIVNNSQGSCKAWHQTYNVVGVWKSKIMDTGAWDIAIMLEECNK